jgi:hypothetical protein
MADIGAQAKAFIGDKRKVTCLSFLEVQDIFNSFFSKRELTKNVQTLCPFIGIGMVLEFHRFH